jgi:hypothetical protein
MEFVNKGYMVAVPIRMGKVRSPQSTIFPSKSAAITEYLRKSGLRPDRMDRRKRDRIWKSFRRGGIQVLPVKIVTG